MDKKGKRAVWIVAALLAGAAIWAIYQFDALTHLKNFHDSLMSH